MQLETRVLFWRNLRIASNSAVRSLRHPCFAASGRGPSSDALIVHRSDERAPADFRMVNAPETENGNDSANRLIEIKGYGVPIVVFTLIGVGPK